MPAGSTLRLQQLLALLGYLPVKFSTAGRRRPTPAAQEAPRSKPPKGSFTWRYPNTPSALKACGSPGSYGVMTQGALMAFENDQGWRPTGSPARSCGRP